MYRKIMGFLEAWKESEHRKPLILQGARQVGKTYSILEFGRTHYENVAYFNFETNPKLNETFEENISPDYLIPILSHIAGQTIVKEKTLIVFDEVQLCERALTSLKYFCENAPDYHIIAAGSFLVLLLIAVTILLISEKQTNKELVMEFNLDKEDLENQYTDFARQYDELKLTVSNDSLSVLLEQEQLKTQRLLEELRTVKSSNATEIRRLKNELASLRKIMIGYINQIDSLNRLTAQQKEIIADVTQKYNAASRQISNLSEEKKNLTKTVTLAAQLDATNISVQPTNKRGKTAKKVKDIVKFKINFSIVKNITAETGERTLYIRITKPDNDVLTKSPSNTFPYENRELVYSIKKYIEYNGEEQTVTVYWDVEEYLYAGTYRVDIFTDGTLIGSQSFNLN